MECQIKADKLPWSLNLALHTVGRCWQARTCRRHYMRTLSLKLGRAVIWHSHCRRWGMAHGLG